MKPVRCVIGMPISGHYRIENPKEPELQKLQSLYMIESLGWAIHSKTEWGSRDYRVKYEPKYERSILRRRPQFPSWAWLGRKGVEEACSFAIPHTRYEQGLNIGGFAKAWIRLKDGSEMTFPEYLNFSPDLAADLTKSIQWLALDAFIWDDLQSASVGSTIILGVSTCKTLNESFTSDLWKICKHLLKSSQTVGPIGAALLQFGSGSTMFQGSPFLTYRGSTTVMFYSWKDRANRTTERVFVSRPSGFNFDDHLLGGMERDTIYLE